jgi:hypothetical protein
LYIVSRPVDREQAADALRSWTTGKEEGYTAGTKERRKHVASFIKRLDVLSCNSSQMPSEVTPPLSTAFAGELALMMTSANTSALYPSLSLVYSTPSRLLDMSVLRTKAEWWRTCEQQLRQMNSSVASALKAANQDSIVSPNYISKQFLAVQRLAASKLRDELKLLAVITSEKRRMAKRYDAESAPTTSGGQQLPEPANLSVAEGPVARVFLEPDLETTQQRAKQYLEAQFQTDNAIIQVLELNAMTFK